MKQPVLVFLSACMFIAGDVAAQTKPTAWTTPTVAQVNVIYPEIESPYLDLHRTPELSMHEQQTATKLAEELPDPRSPNRAPD